MRAAVLRRRFWPTDPEQVCELLRVDLPGWHIHFAGGLYRATCERFNGRSEVSAPDPAVLEATIDRLFDEVTE